MEEDRFSKEILENVAEKKQETLEDALSRHRKEITQLQNKEIAMKKAAAKGSKAEQKAKKKQVDDEIAKFSLELKEKQAEELALFGYSNGKERSNNLDTLVKAIAGASINPQSNSSKPTKSTKRREKRAQEEAAREQRIEEEKSHIISDKMIEDEKLKKKLEPFGLSIIEIRPDGNCLFSAVEDQLNEISGGTSSCTYQDLRKMASCYMREHSQEFLPFFLMENEIDTDSEVSSSERFENYCKEMELSATWGGQLELGALTHCLKKHIIVYSGSYPDVEMGKEYKSKDGIAYSIKLSYHNHAFGLGEHYNSVGFL